MADASLGLSMEERKAAEERAVIRNEIRRDYQRKINNPKAKGMLMDPAVVRWNHARHSSYRFFKATPKTTFLGIMWGLAPPLGLMYLFSKYKNYEIRMFEEGTWKKPRSLMRC
ncbi:NADH dehydrogenase [ubiquinone] 1 beta subcomplex subunit 4-like isoform X2 [Asterias amurensis]|uniref:NADH dehydrogenase [ubiquinone] 1 beta subcomplex subunit 4-like isoform X1 n=1 Tax=Asterias amurensis TaxID=7602 RepID=UPI003AB1944D